MPKRNQESIKKSNSNVNKNKKTALINYKTC